MDHPRPIDPRTKAVYAPDRMGKATLFRSERLLVGLNAFEPGQEHALHAHAGMDKLYHVIEGDGLFLLEGREEPMQAGTLLVAPRGRAARHPQHRPRPPARARRAGPGAVGGIDAVASLPKPLRAGTAG